MSATRKMKSLKLHWVSIFALSSVLLGTVGHSQIRQATKTEQQPAQLRSEMSLEEKLRIAGSQHQIILVLIESGQYKEAAAAFQEILRLGWAGPQEKLLVQSTWRISEQLRKASQFAIAHELVNQALSQVHLTDNVYALLMLRAKMFQEQHQLSRALETLRQAKSLAATP